MSHQTTSCSAYVASNSNEYGYAPSLAAGIVFCSLFGLAMVAHTIQATYSRLWWCHVFSIGCLVEVLGWAARTWSAVCPYEMNAFLMQISTLIIAPTFFTAGIYIILGRLIRLFGPDSSVLTPRLYLAIFCTCDVISLVIQAVGGAMASLAVSQVHGNTKPGTNIMVGGIVFQMGSITVFAICAIDFLYRVMRRQHLKCIMTRTIRILLLATLFSILCIYVRSIYRTIELLQGWSGYLITHQEYFIILDGVMMVCAVVVFNICHPATLLPKDKSRQELLSFDSQNAVEMG